MPTIFFLALIGVLFPAICQIVSAQQPAKIPRVGFLFIGSKDQPHLESFRQGLRDLGYVEDKNIIIENRYAEGNRDVLPTLAAEMVAQKLDIILTTTPQASRAVSQATSTIPIVITGFDPVRLGLAKSLAQPGGNLTGLTSTAGPGMTGKRLELLKEAFPKIKIVGQLTNPSSETREENLNHTKSAAKALGLQIYSHDIKEVGDVDGYFTAFKKAGVNALHMPPSATAFQNSKRLIELATRLRVPAMYSTQILVEQGGLMAYGVNFADLYRRAATYVDKILEGRKPTDLPIEQPMKFDLVVNLKAAKEIGVEVAPNVLVRADRVIR